MPARVQDECITIPFDQLVLFCMIGVDSPGRMPRAHLVVTSSKEKSTQRKVRLGQAPKTHREPVPG